VFGRGPVPSEAIRRQIELLVEPDRMFVVHDGPAVVGSGCSYSFDLALPGGAAVAMQAVSDVGVAPTHRRRGILREIMRAVVDQAVERGEPVAGLTASEATIYRRFGFGVATRYQTLSVDNRRLRLAEAVVGDRGVGREPAAEPSRLRLASAAEAASLLPALWSRSWRRSPGELSRNAGYWAALDVDPEEDRDGATARFVVVHADAAGEPDGAASYRLKWNWASGADNVLAVEDVVATSDAVEAALLRYLLDVDLVNRVEWKAPVDHPLRWWLADSRAVSVTREQDHLWLRPLDVGRCLSSRSYATTDALVVEVIDDDRPAVGGRFRLDAGPDGAASARTTAEPDLSLGVADLGALLLGGVSWATLHRVGLVDERTPGAVARADALFRPERPPYCGTGF
jgi:predicted acetyltransferase